MNTYDSEKSLSSFHGFSNYFPWFYSDPIKNFFQSWFRLWQVGISNSTLVTYYVGGNFQHGALTLQIVTNIESLTLLLPVWRHVLLGLCDKVHSMRLKLSRFNCLPSLGWPIWSMVKFFVCSRFLLIWMTLIKNCSPSCL